MYSNTIPVLFQQRRYPFVVLEVEVEEDRRRRCHQLVSSLFLAVAAAAAAAAVQTQTTQIQTQTMPILIPKPFFYVNNIVCCYVQNSFPLKWWVTNFRKTPIILIKK